jgi:hypothetical protein
MTLTALQMPTNILDERQRFFGIHKFAVFSAGGQFSVEG